jgi:protein-disulfide isomerase
MKRVLPFVIVSVVAIMAIAAALLLYRSKQHSQLSMTSGAKESSGSVHTLGPENASITLDEFGDFQCPPCGRLSNPLAEFQKEYNLRLIFHEFPLVQFHKHALEAARAAEAAGLQGRFWQMHDLLFQNQPNWSNADDVQTLFKVYASMIGLDVERFDKDMATEKISDLIEKDQNQGTALGVKNTPTIFLNNREIDPKKLNPVDLREEIETAKNGAKPSS